MGEVFVLVPADPPLEQRNLALGSQRQDAGSKPVQRGINQNGRPVGVLCDRRRAYGSSDAFARFGPRRKRGAMPAQDQRRRMIEQLEQALALADELKDALTGYIIERALDEARAGMVPSPAGAPRR